MKTIQNGIYHLVNLESSKIGDKVMVPRQKNSRIAPKNRKSYVILRKKLTHSIGHALKMFENNWKWFLVEIYFLTDNFHSSIQFRIYSQQSTMICFFFAPKLQLKPSPLFSTGAQLILRISFIFSKQICIFDAVNSEKF